MFSLNDIIQGYRFLSRRIRKPRTVEAVFTDIYKNNKWGGVKGEFYSGYGSADESMVSPYISLIHEKALSEGFRGLTFVDLGCGDFRVSRQLLSLCSRYTGVDIVRRVVEENQKKFGNEKTHFVHLNAVKDDLPTGDVCFIRHVLQHLSNQQISTILPKLVSYRWVFVTEHFPSANDAIQPNKDMMHGAHIRLSENSGVYLKEPPFHLPAEKIATVMEIPGSDLGDGRDPGVIRTFLYKPRS